MTKAPASVGTYLLCGGRFSKYSHVLKGKSVYSVTRNNKIVSE